MNFRRSVVVFATSLPHTVIGSAVSSLDVVDEILDEGDLILGVDNLQTGCYHLYDEDEVQRYDIDLQERAGSQSVNNIYISLFNPVEEAYLVTVNITSTKIIFDQCVYVYP